MEEALQVQKNTLQLLETDDIAFSSFQEFRAFIIQKINYWINNDFEHLLYLLYRIDVHEDKVRSMLKSQKGGDAATIIADLIIERQQQKVKSRKLFHFSRPEDISEEEAW
jgi:hypothetical protein